MLEYDALSGYPSPNQPRYVHPNLRTIHNRIIASYRDKEFYDGDRDNGYGGYKDDGRWGPIAQNMLQRYSLDNQSSVLHVGCDKGFLLHEFAQIHPSITLRGVEISDYAIASTKPSIRPLVSKASFTELPFKESRFDFVIAIGVVYSLNLRDAIKCLNEIQRVGTGKSFITLAAYETEEDLRLFRYWTLLGCTILKRTDWVEVLKHVGYTGDYKFITAQSLNLLEKSEP